MFALLRKTASGLFFCSISAWLTYAWFTQPFTAEFLGYSLVEQRILIIAQVGLLLASWAYVASTAVVVVEQISARSAASELDSEEASTQGHQQ